MKLVKVLSNANLLRMLRHALTIAHSHNSSTTKRLSPRVSSERSRDWVKALAKAFEEYYDKNYYVEYSQSKTEENKKRKEILYDILVCRKHPMQPMHRNDCYLEYISEAIWQVESEMEINSRAAAYDFSKLVIGCARNKPRGFLWMS